MHEAGQGDVGAGAEGGRRVVGPAMPSAEMLAAAAEAALHAPAQGSEEQVRYAVHHYCVPVPGVGQHFTCVQCLPPGM